MKITFEPTSSVNVRDIKTFHVIVGVDSMNNPVILERNGRNYRFAMLQSIGMTKNGYSDDRLATLEEFLKNFESIEVEAFTTMHEALAWLAEKTK